VQLTLANVFPSASVLYLYYATLNLKSTTQRYVAHFRSAHFDMIQTLQAYYF